jgi:hypothetical protein
MLNPALDPNVLKSSSDSILDPYAIANTVDDTASQLVLTKLG